MRQARLLLMHDASTHRMVLSAEPDTNVLPSELKATLRTASVCPFSVAVHSCDSTFHSLCASNEQEKYGKRYHVYHVWRPSTHACMKCYVCHASTVV